MTLAVAVDEPWLWDAFGRAFGVAFQNRLEHVWTPLDISLDISWEPSAPKSVESR